MITSRLIYAFALVASFIFYLLYPPWISWYLFVLLLVLVPFDLLISMPGMLSKGVLLSVPSVLDKDSDAVLVLTTTHTKSYPVKCIVAKLQVTGDDFSAKCRLRCSADKDGKSEVTIDTSRSGITVFKIKRVWAISLIGLFSVPISTTKSASVLVLPPAIKPVNTVALQHGILLRPKPGGGFSEEHDMRGYRPGDPVRNIHWKVSAKFDSLIIREPLVPPPHSRLLHVIKWNGASECDLVLGCLRWVSEYMLKWQMPYYVKFDDEAMIAEVKQESDLIDFLRIVLDDEAVKNTTCDFVPSRFSWVFRIDAERCAKPGTEADAKAGTSTEAQEQEVVK